MVLQKLCYYSQSLYLVRHDGNPLFPEDFESWRNGPVCYDLFQKHRGKFFIEAKDLQPEVSRKVFTEDQLKAMDDVCERYGSWTGKQLSQKTHQEEPWRAGRKGLNPYQGSDVLIPKKTMTEYYTQHPVLG